LQAEFLEDGLDISKALARLASDVRRGPFTRLPAREKGGLAGDEDEAVGDNAMGVRADRLGMVWQFGDSSHVSTDAELTDVPKGLCAEPSYSGRALSRLPRMSSNPTDLIGSLHAKVY
jgi:hypothetical protein